jgi:hypothetical protein
MTETFKDLFDRVRRQQLEDSRKKKIAAGLPVSYCSCCGEPNFGQGKPIIHDPECMWYGKEENDSENA